MRVMTVLHISFVGAYFELAPFFGIPFEILLQYHYYKNWVLILALLALSHVVFIIILKIVNYFVKKETLKIFRVLIHRNEEEEVEAESKSRHPNEAEIPSFASGNVVSGLRIMSSYYGDPQFFTRFALVQQRSGVRASPMLEIIRFLAIFPSKRAEMLKELKSLKSNSNYNRFMIYFFSKVLTSLINPCSKKNKESLDFYQRSFITHNHLFWVSRKEKKYLKSVAEACSTVYFFSELKGEIQMLISRFPFDTSLYRRFGDILLLSGGDYESSIFFKKFADSIDNKEVILTDNLIHKYINVNPRILHYLNEDEYKASLVNDQTLIQNKIFHNFYMEFYSSTYKMTASYNTNTNTNNKRRRKINAGNSSASNTNTSTNNNLNTNDSYNTDYSINSDVNSTPASPLTTITSNTSNHVPGSSLMNNAANGNDEDFIERPVASYLRVSNRFIPFFPFINNIIVSILILIFLIRVIPLENKVLNNFTAISTKKPQLLRIFVDAGNSILFPFSLAYKEVTSKSLHEFNIYKFVDLNDLMNLNFPENGFYSQNTKIQAPENVSTIFLNRNNLEIIYRNHNKEKVILPKANFNIKTGNDTLKCQKEYSEMINNVIDFFTEISQIKNLTGLMVLHVSKSIKLINEEQHTICDVLQLFYDKMVEFHTISMSSLEDKLNEVIEDFENLYDHIDLYDFTLENLLIYFILMICFIAIYSMLLILQVNWPMKGQMEAVSFLSSRERLESLLLQKTEESWDALTLFLPPETVQFFQLREYGNITEGIVEMEDSDKFLELFDEDRPSMYSNYSRSESSSLEEFEEKYEEEETEKEVDVTHLFSLTVPLVGEFGHNLLLATRKNPDLQQLSDVSLSSTELPVVSNNHISINDNNDGTIEESEKQNTDEMELVTLSNKLFTQDRLSSIVDDALNSTKKSTKFSFLPVYLFIISPWLIMAVSMCLLINPVLSHTEAERELAITALKEGKQLFACFELVQATSEYLYDKRKNLTKFIEIHSILRSSSSSSTSITSYSSQISEYYSREQCFQLLGITCTSVSVLVQEIINEEVESSRITFLILPAFIHFSRTVLEDLFFPESEYIDEMSMISESSFVAVICCLALAYLSYTFKSISFDIPEGFNSLFHFPEKLLNSIDLSNTDNLVKSEMTTDDDFTSSLYGINQEWLNSVMWRVYGTEKSDNLPSTVISIVSLIKNDEIYSISDNVETIFNRTTASFIGQKLNDCFPIVPSENGQTKAIQERQFFMPDLTRKVFHSTTSDKNGWSNLTLMIENDHFHLKKSYKEDSISEKLMNFVPTFFAKSVGAAGVQKFEFADPVVLFLRFDTSLPQTVLEQYFSIVNGCVMNFTSMKAIHADGGLFVFTAVKQVNPLVPFLFARDLIEESRCPKRGKPTNGTFAILLEKVEAVTAEISQDEEEPFLETSLGKEVEGEKGRILFNLGRDQICFESGFEDVLKGITKGGMEMANGGDGDGCRLVRLSFAQYLSNVRCIV